MNLEREPSHGVRASIALSAQERQALTALLVHLTDAARDTTRELRHRSGT
jgi:hypothetical protein